jgi:hypothetical protein
MDLIITIDTEADNQWRRGDTITIENISYIPRFQNLCDRYNFKPTYLCTYEVITSQEFDKILKPYHEISGAEIGAHLHPWTNPPFENSDTNDHSNPYPSELPIELFHQKMEMLTNSIDSKLGLKPSSYRAGRWGFCASHIPILLSLGYKVDCSVTPLVSWEDTPGRQTGGPDFRNAPVEPYFLDFEDTCLSGTSQLLEVPVTILFTNGLIKNSKYFQKLFLRYRNNFACKILNRLFKLGPQWFRPYPYMTAKSLKDICRIALQQDLPVIEMMFHSSELMPGCSPYNLTSESVERMYDKLEVVFEYLSKEQCKGVTLSEFAEKLSSNKIKRLKCDR